MLQNLIIKYSQVFLIDPEYCKFEHYLIFSLDKRVPMLMDCFHWDRQAGNYAFLESQDHCLHSWLGQLQVTNLSGRVSDKVADPCI